MNIHLALDALQDKWTTQAEIKRMFQRPVSEPYRTAKAALKAAEAVILMLEYYTRGIKRGVMEPLEFPEPLRATPQEEV